MGSMSDLDKHGRTPPAKNDRYPLGQPVLLDFDGGHISLQPKAIKVDISVSAMRVESTFNVYTELTFPRIPTKLLLSQNPFTLAWNLELGSLHAGELISDQFSAMGYKNAAIGDWRQRPIIRKILWKGMRALARARDPVFAKSVLLADPDPADAGLAGVQARKAVQVLDKSTGPALIDPLEDLAPVAVDSTGARLYLCRVYPFRKLYESIPDASPGHLMHTCLVTIAPSGRTLRINSNPATHQTAIAQARSSGMLAVQVPEDLMNHEGPASCMSGLAQPARARRRI